MSSVVPDPNQALAGDLFSQADLSTGFVTDIVEDGEYTLLLGARYNKKDGGIIFVEGKIQAGVFAGKNVKVFSAVLDGNTSKRANQKGVALTNLSAIGISPEVLNTLARQVGAVAGNLEPLYKAVEAMIEGRIINASLVQNSYTGKNGQVTDMQSKIGGMSLVSAPQVAVGGTPALAAPAPAVVAAPAVAVAAPPVAPPPAPAPVAVAPVVEAPVAAPAPIAAPVAAVAEAPVVVAPVAVAPPPLAPAPVAVAPVAAAPAPVAAAPVAEVPVAVAPAPAPVAPVPGTVVVAPEPGF